MGIEFCSISGYECIFSPLASGLGSRGRQGLSPTLCSSVMGRGTELCNAAKIRSSREHRRHICLVGTKQAVPCVCLFPLCSCSASLGCHPEGQRRERGFREAAELTKITAL